MSGRLRQSSRVSSLLPATSEGAMSGTLQGVVLRLLQ